MRIEIFVHGHTLELSSPAHPDEDDAECEDDGDNAANDNSDDGSGGDAGFGRWRGR